MLAAACLTVSAADELKKRSAIGQSLIGGSRTGAGPVAKENARSFPVSGVIHDESGKPVADAECLLSGLAPRTLGETRLRTVNLKTTSDAQGRFHFDAVPEGIDLMLSVRHPDHMMPSPSIPRFRAEDEVKLEIVMPKSNHWLSGVVTGVADGKPVKNARVFVTYDSSSLSSLKSSVSLQLRSALRVTTTDEKGRYRVGNWISQRQNCLLMIDAPGMAFTQVKFAWDGGDMTLDHALEAEPGVTGRVVDDSGRPVPGATIRLVEKMIFMDNLEDKRPSSLDGYWLGSEATDAAGRFSGRLVGSQDTETLWLVIHHPAEGFHFARLKDWKPDGDAMLTRWSSAEGRLFGADEQPVAGAQIKVSQTDSRRSAAGGLELMAMKSSVCTTDAQGRYRLDRLIPGRSNFIRVNDASLRMQLGEVEPGGTLQMNLRIPSQPAPVAVPGKNSRTIRGRVSIPENVRLRDGAHEIEVMIYSTATGGMLNPLKSDGSFESNPLPPRNYTLRIVVRPTDRTMTAVSEAGLTLPFVLEEDAQQQPLDLGSFPLSEADFKFRPVSAANTPAASAPKIRLSLDAPAADAASFATWAGGDGAGVGAEIPFTQGGRVTGNLTADSNVRFIIRATKPDGSQHYTAALTGPADEKSSFGKELRFTSGVALEGRLRDLPEDYAGDGWVVAAVRVKAHVAPGTLVRGVIPSLLWRAWAPVARDGTFRFSSLPRGALTLSGFGLGWTTRDSYNFSTDMTASLLTQDTVVRLVADTRPTTTRTLRVLRADGNPAVGTTVTVVAVTSSHLTHALTSQDCAVETSAGEAFRKLRQLPVTGHTSTTDAEGIAKLSNLPAGGKTVCEVKWIDSLTRRPITRRVEIPAGLREPLVVRLD